MATPLTGANELLKDFAGGQGLGINNYYTYAADHDGNYTKLEVTVNQLVNELSAIQGPNAALILDSVLLTDPLGPEGLLAEGVMGQHSFKVSVGSPNTELDIARGEAVVNGIRVTMGSGVSMVNPGGGPADHYVALDAFGAPTIETSAGQQQLDIARVAFGGVNYGTAPVYQLAEILFDGDENAELHRRPKTGDATTPTFPIMDYDAGTSNPFRYISNRILDIEKILAGIKTGSEDGTLGAIGIAGTVGAPGMITTNGSVFDTGTGLYRVGADVLGISVEQVLCLRFELRGSTRQVLLENAGTLANPAIARHTDANTGINWPGNDQLDIITNQIIRASFDANGNIDLPTNARVKGVRSTSQSIPDNTSTKIQFGAADDFDIGNGTDTWHDESGTAADKEAFEVPTGCDGLYCIIADYEWASPTNITDISIEVLVGVAVDPSRVEDQIPAGEPRQGQLVLYRTLTAGNVVRMRVLQDDTGGAAALNLERASLSIIKVA